MPPAWTDLVLAQFLGFHRCDQFVSGLVVRAEKYDFTKTNSRTMTGKK